MKKDRKCYLGIDVSKLWFDISVLIVTEKQKQPMLRERFDNSASGLALMGKWLSQHQVPMDENSLLVIENTGIYHRLIWVTYTYRQCCTDQIEFRYYQRKE